MGRVRKADLPACSALWDQIGKGDFIDCYATRSDMAPRQAAQQAFSMPGWARALMGLRNRIVAPFGLKTGPMTGIDAIGFFPVISETPDEIILGLNDRHLDFRIAVLRQTGTVYGATWVHCHNIWGRAYLTAIMPFHILLSRNALGRVTAP